MAESTGYAAARSRSEIDADDSSVLSGCTMEEIATGAASPEWSGCG